MSQPIKLLVADDTLIVREGLKQILAGVDGLLVVSEATTAQSAVEVTEASHPDVAILGLSWYGDETAGITATKYIVQNNGVKVLVLSDRHDLITAARKAGASAGLGYSCTKAQLVELLRCSHRARGFVATSAEGDEEIDEFASWEEPTPREKQVLQLLVEGRAIRQIALELDIAPSTVKNHVQAIYGKLQVQNRAEVVRRALKLGLAQ